MQRSGLQAMEGRSLPDTYVYRKRRFPDRPYRNLPDFPRRMAALGPGFWRTLFE